MKKLKRILLAEDNPNDVELTLAALKEAHLANEVFVVRDGAEALAYLRNAWTEGESAALPAVVLIDLKMPRVDGLEVLRTMKTDPRFSNVPVVMLTSSREDRDLLESYKLGVNAYVVKPVAFQAFLDAIKGLGLFWAVINETPVGAARAVS